MPQPAEDVIYLTDDSGPEDAVQHAAMHLRPNQQQKLNEAIKTCPGDKLRDILVNMVAQDVVSTHALFETLVAFIPPQGESGVQDTTSMTRSPQLHRPISNEPFSVIMPSTCSVEDEHGQKP